MKIITLQENTKKESNLKAIHGLSIYIEVFSKRILLDTGLDGSFIDNAKIIGVDLSRVDIVVISHYHSDHIGGLRRFLELNSKAQIYISKNAFNNYYIKSNDEIIDLSIDINLKSHDQVILIDDYIELCDGIRIISNFSYNYDNILNDKFYIKENGKFLKDEFSHEVALILEEQEHIVLMSGCFHSGVINIVEKAKCLGFDITHVVGGFHLENSKGLSVSDDYINKLAKYLNKNNITGYTGHCTGERRYSDLKELIDCEMHCIYTGSEHCI